MPRTKPTPLKTGATEKQVTEQVCAAAACLGIELKRRNVGGMTNASGRYVAFGEAGDSDWYCHLPDSRYMEVEIKHENFDASKLRGKKKEHFDRQLAKLQKTNERGGIGFVCDDAGEFLMIMQIVLRGGWVEESGYAGLVVYDPDKKD